MQEYRAYKKNINKGIQNTGQALNSTGDVIALIGYVAAPFTGGASLSLSAIGEVISVTGKGIEDAAIISDEGITDENRVDLAIDLAFEVVPMAAEVAVKKTNLDKVAKDVITSEMGKLKIGSENAIEKSKDEKTKAKSDSKKTVEKNKPTTVQR